MGTMKGQDISISKCSKLQPELEEGNEPGQRGRLRMKENCQVMIVSYVVVRGRAHQDSGLTLLGYQLPKTSRRKAETDTDAVQPVDVVRAY